MPMSATRFRRDSRGPTEAAIQHAIIELLRFTAAPGLIYYHCPNGEMRSERTGARLKRLGVKRGVADLCFVLPDGRAAFMEVKRPGGQQSTDQRAFELQCEATGAPYRIAHSSKEAETIFEEWGAIRKTCA